MEASRALARVELGPTTDQADKALKYIDTIITDIYMPSRGAEGFKTERATLSEVPHMPHRENIAEHSWHLAFTILVLYDNREELGLNFPDDFDENLAATLAVTHDIPAEVFAGDIDAMKQTNEVRKLKIARELAAMAMVRRKYPFLNKTADRWESYDDNDSYEAEFAGDMNHIVGTRMICMDGGRRWHEWEGMQTSREEMVACMRGKLRTESGHAIFDALERDLDNHPEWFPKIYPQDQLFET